MDTVRVSMFPELLDRLRFRLLQQLMLCPHQLQEEFLREVLRLLGGDAWHVLDQEVVHAPVDAQPAQRILRRCAFV